MTDGKNWGEIINSILTNITTAKEGAGSVTGIPGLYSAIATSQSLTDAAIKLNASGGAIIIDDNGHKRISWNDGTGNFNLRGGHYIKLVTVNGATTNVTTYAKSAGDGNGGAAFVSLASDASDGIITLAVAPIGAPDTAVTWANSLTLDKTQLSSPKMANFTSLGATTIAKQITTITATDSPSLFLQAPKDRAPYISFHRIGQFAANFGLDIDNQFAMGGWSSGDGYTGLKAGSLTTYGANYIVGANANIRGSTGPSFNPYRVAGGLLTGWNRTAGQGEVDFISARVQGLAGGFNFYDLPLTADAVPNLLLSLGANGALTTIGPITGPTITDIYAKVAAGAGGLKLDNDKWLTTLDGKNRFFFSKDGETYFGTQLGYSWRSKADTNLMNLDPAGNLIVGGKIRSQGTSDTPSIPKAAATAAQAGLEILAKPGNAAYISFHKSGSYGANFGLDGDNQFAFGGWSAGDNYSTVKTGQLVATGLGVLAATAGANQNLGTFGGIVGGSNQRLEIYNQRQTATTGWESSALILQKWVDATPMAYLGFYKDRTDIGGDLVVTGTIRGVNNITPTNGTIRLTPNLHLNSGPKAALYVNYDSGAVPAGEGANPVLFVGNGAGGALMIVNYNGYVGIGTNSPSATLHLNGSLKVKTVVLSGNSASGQNIFYDVTPTDLYISMTGNGNYVMLPQASSSQGRVIHVSGNGNLNFVGVEVGTIYYVGGNAGTNFPVQNRMRTFICDGTAWYGN